MANNIIQCTEYDMLKVEAIINQIYYCTDSRKLYKDYGTDKNSRQQLIAEILANDNVRLNRTMPVIGKMYYVEDTNMLWKFTGRWEIVGGQTTEHNTYAVHSSSLYNGQIVTSINNTDNYITGKYGDRIIDNNGLLGDGSIVIRDNNRILRGQIEANTINSELVFKSQLDNGLLFIPNAHLPYTDLSTSYGALHLSVDNDDNSYIGAAHYYGNWNNYGSMNIIKEISESISAGYVPNETTEIMKINITCFTTEHIRISDTDVLVKSFISIRPISDTQAIAQIISVDNYHENSVVINDFGEYIFTNIGELIENVTVNCDRKIKINNDEITSTYKFPSHKDVELSITSKPGLADVVDIPECWCNQETYSTYSTRLWKKSEVLTSDDKTFEPDTIIRIK